MDVLQPFRRRPLRSSLLLLQVYLGSLVMTLALSAALGSRTPEAPPERFNLLAGYETEDTLISFGVFHSKDLLELTELAPDVDHLAMVSYTYEPIVVVGDTRYALRAAARVSAGYFELEPPELIQGTVFTDAEVEGGEEVALLSERATRALFGDADPIGKILNLEVETFDPEAEPEPPTSYRIIGTFNSFVGGRFSDQPALYLPYTGFDNPTDLAFGQPTATLAAKAKPGRGEAARAQLLSAARQLYANAIKEQGGEEGKDFLVETPGEATFGPEGIDQDLLVFGLFGVVAFVVSAIGIFSVTLIETEERTFEIGVRRALGASATRIGWSLVARALSVALVGSLAGIVGAALLIPILQGPAQSVAMFGGTRLVFEPLAALITLSAIVLVSGVLGLVPAFRVGRLRPVQALREGV